MIRLLVIAAIAVLLYYGWKWFKKEYSEKGRPFLVKSLLVATAAALLLLAAFGRVHWVGAALASLLAGLRIALPLLARSLPFLMKWRDSQASERSSILQNNDANAMDEATAMATLGIEKPYTRDEVLKAHKRIMQNIHPDKGGSDLLASQVNLAKEFLLELLEKNSSS